MDAAGKPRVVLIDLSSLFWAAWHVHNENGVQEARSATLAGVKRACGEGNDLVAICCDSGRSFRKDLSPEYKAQREKQPQAAYGELERTKERLRADGFLLWQVDNFEADDVIATACDLARVAGHEVRVCSADKDMLQLLGPGVDCLRTHTWSVVGEKEFTEKYRIKPAQFRDWLALKGDSSDNVPGCDGIGDKWASDLVARFGTVAKLYAALDAGTADLPKKLTENLIACRERVKLSEQLVALRYDVPIDFQQLYTERKVTPLTETSDLPPSDDAEPSDVPTATEPGATSVPLETTQGPAPGERTAEPVSVALVPVEYERQLEPRNLSAAAWLGKHMHNSRLYQKFPTPEAVTAVIIRGREMGLGALTALDCFHVIEGKPSPYAYLIIARAKSHPDCEYFYCKEANDTSATWVTKNKRNPVETSVTYTIEQARTANLLGQRNGWAKNPEDMLTKTAGAKLARREYPDAALGLYAVEELGGE